jgi:hypothetical protein
LILSRGEFYLDINGNGLLDATDIKYE